MICDTANILSWRHKMQHLTFCSTINISALKGFNDFFEQQQRHQCVIKSHSDCRLILTIYTFYIHGLLHDKCSLILVNVTYLEVTISAIQVCLHI